MAGGTESGEAAAAAAGAALVVFRCEGCESCAFVLYRVDDKASPRGPLGTRRSLISNGAALLPAAAAAAQRVFPRE